MNCPACGIDRAKALCECVVCRCMDPFCPNEGHQYRRVDTLLNSLMAASHEPDQNVLRTTLRAMVVEWERRSLETAGKPARNPEATLELTVSREPADGPVTFTCQGCGAHETHEVPEDGQIEVNLGHIVGCAYVAQQRRRHHQQWADRLPRN